MMYWRNGLLVLLPWLTAKASQAPCNSEGDALCEEPMEADESALLQNLASFDRVKGDSVLEEGEDKESATSQDAATEDVGAPVRTYQWFYLYAQAAGSYLTPEDWKFAGPQEILIDGFDKASHYPWKWRGGELTMMSRLGWLMFDDTPFKSEFEGETGFRFKMTWRQSKSYPKSQEWFQTSNPMTQPVSGFKPTHSRSVPYTVNDFNGLKYDGDKVLLYGSNVCCHYAVGTQEEVDGGIPGPDGSVEYAELWVWVQNYPFPRAPPQAFGMPAPAPAPGTPVWLDLLGKPTIQSEVSGVGHSYLAVDGDPFTHGRGCTVPSKANDDVFWQVGLGQTYEVLAVNVTNYPHPNHDKMRQFEILVGEHSCGKDLSLEIGETKEFSCNGAKGASVTIRDQKKKNLIICEVGVKVAKK